MASFEVKLPTRCSIETATKCVDKWMARLRAQHADLIKCTDISWHDGTAKFSFALRVLGETSVTGAIEVKSSCLHMRGDVPWKVAVLKGRITKVISETFDARCRECPNAREN
jgi:hypothetical protein